MSDDRIIARKESVLVLLRMTLTAGAMAAVSLFPLMASGRSMTEKVTVAGMVVFLCGIFAYTSWRALR